MPDWDGPKWRNQGRTGPGPFAPKYSNRKDRGTVRRGGTPGKKSKGCAIFAFGVPAGILAIAAIVGERVFG